MSVRTAVEALLQDPFGLRETGEETITSARIRPARPSDTGPSIQPPMPNLSRESEQYRRKIADHRQPVVALRDSPRNRAGGRPNSRLKARLNAGSDSYPT